MVPKVHAYGEGQQWTASWVNVPSSETHSHSISAARMRQDRRRIRHAVVADFVIVAWSSVPILMESLKQRINTGDPLAVGSNYRRALCFQRDVPLLFQRINTCWNPQAKNGPLDALLVLRVYEALSCSLAYSYEALKEEPQRTALIFQKTLQLTLHQTHNSPYRH